MLICVILSCRKAGKQNAKSQQEAEGRTGKGIHRESATRYRVRNELDQEGCEACQEQKVQPHTHTEVQSPRPVRCDGPGRDSRILRTTGCKA